MTPPGKALTITVRPKTTDRASASAAAGRSFQWYLDTFPDHHIFIVYAADRTNPYLRLAPLTPDQPEIAVNLLLLPKIGTATLPG